MFFFKLNKNLQGAPAEKLIMGVPFYGRSFTLADLNNHAVGDAHIGRGMAGPYSIEPGIVGYNELCEMFQKQPALWHQMWEPNQMVPYAFNGRQWIGYENEKSIALKVDYIKKHNLGGIMIWSIESDDFKGVCGPQRYPLLTLINSNLNNKEPQIHDAANGLESAANSNIYELCQGKNGYIRDPRNCGKFYFCDKGDVFSFNCPSALYFDLNSLSCNYFDVVDCNNNTLT